MRKLNKKGIAAIEFGILVMAIAGVSFTTASLSMKNPNAFSSFRAKKAMEYCQTEGGSADACKETVSGMSKEQVLAYVQDTADRPRP
jgi:hypothetical protein